MNAIVRAMDGTRSLVTNGQLYLYGVIDPEAFFQDSIRAIDVADSIASLPVGGWPGRSSSTAPAVRSTKESPSTICCGHLDGASL